MYEYHVTIGNVTAIPNTSAHYMGWKVLRLQLNGVPENQIMLTHHTEDELTENDIFKELGHLDIKRFKVECLAKDRPKDHNDGYFEMHIKVKDVAKLKGIEYKDLMVSKNLNSPGKRFVNYRCKGTYYKAVQHLNEILILLIQNGIRIYDVEFEYVLFDSNLSLDDGWRK